MKSKKWILIVTTLVLMQQAYAVELTLSNFTDYSMMSFRVMTGKFAGKCASKLVPKYRLFAAPGTKETEVPIEGFRDKVCGGTFPCQLDVFLGSGLCIGNKWGSVGIKLSDDGEHLDFIVLQVMTPKTRSHEKMKLIGDTDSLSIQRVGLKRQR